MSYSLRYHFERLPVGSLRVTGVAEISFDRDGDWSIDEVSAYLALDAEDNELPIPCEAEIIAALNARCADEIGDAVDAYEIDDEADRACWKYHMGAGA